MKDENQSVGITNVIQQLASLSAMNQEVALNWCDALLSRQHTDQVVESCRFDPKEETLHYDGHQVSVLNASGDPIVKPCHCPTDGLVRFVQKLLAKLSENHLEHQLPPRLRRLLMWTPNAPLPAPQQRPTLPTSLTHQTNVFYEHRWHYYRADSFTADVQNGVLLTIGKSFSERVQLADGQTLQRYDGACLLDQHGRIYGLEADHVSRFGNDGTRQWRQNYPYRGITKALLSSKDCVCLIDRENMVSFNTHNGRIEWQQPVSDDASHHVSENVLYELTLGERTALRMLPLATPKAQHICSIEAEAVGHWWSEKSLLIATADQAGAISVMHMIDLENHKHYECRLPPSSIQDHRLNNAVHFLILDMVDGPHLCQWRKGKVQPTLKRLPFDSAPAAFVHADNESMVIVSRDRRIFALETQSLKLRWTSAFAETNTTALRLSRMHRNLLVIPAAPPTLVESKTGAHLGQITDELYRFATPLLVDEQHLLLSDDSGYIGSFAISGHLSDVSLDP